jgi:GMP synthase-like glutamine amidotransferase
MRIHCFQHVGFETPANISEWIETNGHSVDYTRFFEKEFEFPEIDSIDVLLVLGGYMNADDDATFPWLKAEKEFINQAISAAKKVIGICLGSQLIASASGAKVFAAKEKEIGFFPIEFSDEALSDYYFAHFTKFYTVFHWHGDTFKIPDKARRIASTETTENQGFYLDKNVLAFQFHLEMNEEVIEEMLLQDGKELAEKGRFIQDIETVRRGFHHLKQNKADLFLLLDKFLAND